MTLEDIAYYCRFNVKPSNVRQLVGAEGLEFGKLTDTFDGSAQDVMIEE
ncbi:hypothetical protein NDA01_27190 [Trichocoleus desertorum AS-A10]